MTNLELFAEICDRVRSPLAVGILTIDPEIMKRQFIRIEKVLSEIEERLKKQKGKRKVVFEGVDTSDGAIGSGDYFTEEHKKTNRRKS